MLNIQKWHSDSLLNMGMFAHFCFDTVVYRSNVRFSLVWYVNQNIVKKVQTD